MVASATPFGTVVYAAIAPAVSARAARIPPCTTLLSCLCRGRASSRRTAPPRDADSSSNPSIAIARLSFRCRRVAASKALASFDNLFFIFCNRNRLAVRPLLGGVSRFWALLRLMGYVRPGRFRRVRDSSTGTSAPASCRRREQIDVSYCGRSEGPTAAVKMRVGITCYPTYGGSGVVATELGQ